MKKVRKYGRVWHLPEGISESVLEPWAENPELLRENAVKENAVRFVARTTAEDGTECYIKVERKFHLPFLFRSKAESEFLAFELLRKHGIPSAEFLFWSASTQSSVTGTRALPERFQPLIRFWYSRKTDEEKREILTKICAFLAGFAKTGLTHPDLHMGNLMTDGRELRMIDPPGTTECARTDSPDPLLLTPLTEVFGDIPDAEIARKLLESGLYKNQQQALSAMDRIREIRRDTIEREWPRRVEQILSGSSKFATETETGVFLRNTAWFEPAEIPAETDLEEKTYSRAEGEKLWTESFRKQLLKESVEKVPVKLIKENDFVRILFLKEKKNALFYGFR